jgi:hypothetical protein
MSSLGLPDPNDQASKPTTLAGISDSIELVFSEVRSKLEAQERNLDSLDQKATILVGFMGVILTVLLGLRAHHVSAPTKYCWAAATVMVVATLLLLVRALWIKDWHLPPKPDALKAYVAEPKRCTLGVLTDSMSKAYETNRKVLAAKVICIKLAYVLLCLAALAISASFLFRLFVS